MKHAKKVDKNGWDEYYMTMSSEVLNIIWELAAVIFAAGAVWAELKAVRKDIARLEEKVERHNSFDRRIVRLESYVDMKTAEEKGL